MGSQAPVFGACGGRSLGHNDNRAPRNGIFFSVPTGYLMNKSELIESIATKASLTRAQAASALDAALGSITEALVAGDAVAILGFGNFKVSERAARTGKNPATGEALEIAAATVPKFTPGKALKDAVNVKK